MLVQAHIQHANGENEFVSQANPDGVAFPSKPTGTAEAMANSINILNGHEHDFGSAENSPFPQAPAANLPGLEGIALSVLTKRVVSLETAVAMLDAKLEAKMDAEMPSEDGRCGFCEHWQGYELKGPSAMLGVCTVRSKVFECYAYQHCELFERKASDA